MQDEQKKSANCSKKMGNYELVSRQRKNEEADVCVCECVLGKKTDKRTNSAWSRRPDGEYTISNGHYNIFRRSLNFSKVNIFIVDCVTYRLFLAKFIDSAFTWH